MKSSFAFAVAIAVFALGSAVFGAEGSTSPYTDSVGDIGAGISTGNGTLDILGMEVTNTATDLNFNLTVNGNVSTTDWGKFMIGIGSDNAPLGTTTGNGWGRPINLQYTPDGFPTPGGMDYWIGSWVDGGGGAQLWTWDGAAWSGPASLGAFSFTPGATSDVNFTVSLTSLGLALGDQFTFDAYSSGAGNGDTSIDSPRQPIRRSDVMGGDLHVEARDVWRRRPELLHGCGSGTVHDGRVRCRRGGRGRPVDSPPLADRLTRLIDALITTT